MNLPAALPQVITDTAALADFCAACAQHPFIALDTEFMRERTYYAELCLVQIAADEGLEAVIDPLAKGLDLTPLYDLMANDKVLKVLHASRQDLEIFYHAMGRVPAPLFDTQLAAQVIGLGENISYDQFIRQLTGHGLDKASRFTDWAKRPLSDKQLRYAIGDVTYLLDAYEKLIARMEKMGRADWMNEEMAALAAPSLYAVDPREVWRRIKAGHRSPKMLAVLRELAAWREQQAMRINIPRGRLLKDEALVELAASQPRSIEDISHIRGLERGLNPGQKQAILAAIETALAIPPDEWPQQAERPKDTGRIEGAVAMLQLLLKTCAEEHRITPSLITGRDELESLARGETGLPVQSGWRYELFGHAAEKMLRGETGIRFDPRDKKPHLFDLPAP